ncbi:MAG TPA: S53 family peptidase [Gaiellaceae bacterium]|nr:S53 family peptidase [Gaiellaceae bacterium]
MKRWGTLSKLTVLALPLAALVSAAAASAGSSQLYAVGKPVCKAPKHLLTAGNATCTAMRRVLVKVGTKGAQPFTPAAGATGASTMGPNLGLTPSDLVSAYHLSTSASAGSNQTVAIVDAFNDPKIKSDLATFDTQYGLPCNNCLTVVSQTGSTTSLPPNDTTGWSIEESLDVQAVHGICPACHILLVEATSDSDANLATAENEAATLGATEISNSFGGPEAGTTSSFAAAFNHPGVVITASSGDDGYYDFDLLGADGVINQPEIPAAYNTVVAVGGTSLYLGQSATRTSETVWNDNGPQAVWEANLGFPLGAGGGGCSTLFTATGWQASQAGYASAVCGGKRLVADVSMVADPLTGYDIYDSFNCGAACSTGWQTFGGTSLSAPLVAAAYALSGGAHGVTYPSLTLYGHPKAFFDVTVGGNGICDGEGAAQCPDYSTNGTFDLGAGMLDCAYTPAAAIAAGTGACDAAPGFDGPSGLGTPNAQSVFNKAVPTFTISPAPTTANVNVSASFGTTKPSDPFPGGSVTKYTWNWGDGTANTVTSGSTSSVTHTFTTTGTKTVTVTANDNYDVTNAKTLKVTVS